MKIRTRVLLGGFVAAAVIAPASAGVASQSIAWTWNSGDHDTQAKFAADGDNYHAKEVRGNGYVNWSGPIGSGRWNVPGAATNTDRVLNLDMPENKSVSMKVCEDKNNFPDDCSSTKTGVS